MECHIRALDWMNLSTRPEQRRRYMGYGREE